MKEEKLALWLEFWFMQELPPGGLDEEKEAYCQIKALIQKPGVTEEWIEEKAKKMKEMVATLFRKTGTMNYPLGRCKDFIRSLVEEIRK